MEEGIEKQIFNMHTEEMNGTNALNSAKDVNDTQFHQIDWRFWCRLCAKDDFNGNINIVLKDEQMAANRNNLTEVLSLSAAIEKYFSINVNHDELLPKMLCKDCFSLVTSLISFSERISRVQHMFHNLVTISACDNLDVHSLRLKYGVIDDEREHILIPHILPEVHYFEAKPKISDLENFEDEIEFTTANPLEQATDAVNIKKENTIEEHRELDEVEEDPFNESDNLNEEYHANSLLELDSSSSDEICNSNKEQSQKKLQLSKFKDKSLGKVNNEICRQFDKPSKYIKVKMPESNNVEKSSIKENSSNKRQYENHTCSECPRKFKRIQQYRQHLERVHAKLLPKDLLTCTDCNRSFTTNYELERHSKIHLPIQHRKVIPCPYCDKKLASNTSVQTHIKYIHMNERPFICEECGVAVRTNAALKGHMLTHTDYAPFICEICKKGFKSQIRLKNHMETHDPNKHICAECGLQLNSRATLNRHLLVHSDKMQHKCDYCGRAFKRVKALKNHLILHTGLKPYSCDFCDRTFANGSNCRSHKKKAHPQELAALEASGGGKQYTRNIPKLETLKAVTKATDNLAPVVSKQSGCFAFGKKPKPQVTKKDVVKSKISKTVEEPTPALDSSIVTPGNRQVNFNSLSTIDSFAASSIPTFDNIYNHLMKKTSNMSHEPTNTSSNLHLKRPSIQNTSCIRIDHDSNASDMPNLPIEQHHHINSQLHSEHAQINHGTLSVASHPSSNFYNQIMKQSSISNDSQVTGPLTSLQHHEAIRSPDTDSQNSFITATDDQSNVSTNFFLRQDPFM